MPKLNDTKIETLTSEHVQLCHSLKELIDSSELPGAFSHLVEQLCDESELIDLRINISQMSPIENGLSSS